jgi:phospholipid/cholesterol/gamma-HCH transport system ATP-binding protein
MNTIPLIRIEDLHKSFNSQVVLDGINLDVERGQSVVVIGQSGTGKSVLLKHVLRLMTPDRGRVYVDGSDISKYSYGEMVEVRRRFGMLFQSAALFDSMTVAENVGLGLRESRVHAETDIEDIVRNKLEMVGLSAAIDKYPSELSGGMRKRVGLARAIANDPDVLLYDEPTTGLDPITSDMIDDMIVELRERLKVTSIAVTHDMKSAFKIADRIVMLYQGSVVFDGSPDEVRTTDNAIVRQFVNGQAKGPIQVR